MNALLTLLFVLSIDPRLPAEARAPLDIAAQRWADTRTIPQPLDITINFVPGSPACGISSSTCLASTRQRYDYSWDVRFNSIYDYYWGVDGNPSPGQIDFLSIVLHEYGHVMGLEHSRDPNNVMFNEFEYGKSYHGRELK